MLEGSGQITAPAQRRYEALNQSAQAVSPANVLARWRLLFELKRKHAKASLDEKLLEINIADEFLVADRFADLLVQFLAQLVLAFRVAQFLGCALGEVHDDVVADFAA